MEKRANVHTAECTTTNLDEIKEPLYIIIYVVYNLFLCDMQTFVRFRNEFFRLYRLYIFLHFIVLLYFYVFVSPSPE